MNRPHFHLMLLHEISDRVNGLAASLMVDHQLDAVVAVLGRELKPERRVGEDGGGGENDVGRAGSGHVVCSLARTVNLDRPVGVLEGLARSTDTDPAGHLGRSFAGRVGR